MSIAFVRWNRCPHKLLVEVSDGVSEVVAALLGDGNRVIVSGLGGAVQAARPAIHSSPHFVAPTLSCGEGGMDFYVVVGDWATLKVDARLVREEVFIQEQKVPVAEEWDGVDEDCLHAVAYDRRGGGRGGVLGTARLLPDGHIGRMAVRKPGRGNGVGGELLKHMMQEAKARGHGEVLLSAQIQAEKFYTRHGFVREGEEYMDAGIAHVQMRHIFATPIMGDASEN